MPTVEVIDGDHDDDDDDDEDDDDFVVADDYEEELMANGLDYDTRQLCQVSR